jgi:hypothetical protein
MPSPASPPTLQLSVVAQLTAMARETTEQAAERWLYQRLAKILGPDRHGLAAYGLRFDPAMKRQYIGVDFEEGVPSAVLGQIPRHVGNVDVRVRRLSLRLEKGEQ